MLDLCSGQWTPFVVNEDVPEWRQRPAPPGLLDIYTAAGPAYRPLSDGQTVSTPGGWLRPKLHVPRPYMGLHQLGGRPLQRDDGPTVTLAEAGAPSARRPGTYVFRLIGETLVVWGGLEADGWTHTGATFDIASGSWRPMSVTGAPPAMLKVKAAAWTGPYLTVLGTHRETRAPLRASPVERVSCTQPVHP